jgi:hypothetical protein
LPPLPIDVVPPLPAVAPPPPPLLAVEPEAPPDEAPPPSVEVGCLPNPEFALPQPARQSPAIASAA